MEASIYEAFLAQLQAEGGYLVNEEQKKLLQAAYWDAEGHRTPETIARPASVVAERAGFEIPAGKGVPHRARERTSASEYPFSTEKLGTVLAIFKYSGFDAALDMVKRIFAVGGKGHSCGIYSFDDDHIHRLALTAPVSRIMVRQVQSSSNAGHVHQRHAHDVEHGLRRVGREHHEREHLPEALHERDLGEPPHRGGPAFGAGAVRRVLRHRGLVALGRETRR